MRPFQVGPRRIAAILVSLGLALAAGMSFGTGGGFGCPSTMNYGELQGCYVPGGQAKTVTFQGSSGEKVLFRLRDYFNTATPTFTVFSPGGSQLCTDSGTNEAQEECTLQQTGTHRIVLPAPSTANAVLPALRRPDEFTIGTGADAHLLREHHFRFGQHHALVPVHVLRHRGRADSDPGSRHERHYGAGVVSAARKRRDRVWLLGLYLRDRGVRRVHPARSGHLYHLGALILRRSDRHLRHVCGAAEPADHRTSEPDRLRRYPLEQRLADAVAAVHVLWHRGGACADPGAGHRRDAGPVLARLPSERLAAVLGRHLRLGGV